MSLFMGTVLSFRVNQMGTYRRVRTDLRSFDLIWEEQGHG